MSVESVRRAVESSIRYSGYDVTGLDTSRRDEWRSLVKSGELNYRITEKTPQLNRIEELSYQMMNSFYNQMLWAFHSGARSLNLIQELLNDNMNRADEIKALIEATPEDDVDDGYGYGIDADSYGVRAAEEGYVTASTRDK